MFEWAGLGFSRDESHRLCTSLNKLFWKTKAQNIRFWGKMLTRNRDYYIVET